MKKNIVDILTKTYGFTKDEFFLETIKSDSTYFLIVYNLSKYNRTLQLKQLRAMFEFETVSNDPAMLKFRLTSKY